MTANWTNGDGAFASSSGNSASGDSPASSPFYPAVAVEDGREAYRILQSDADFSGAIFDMMMPNLDGLEVIRYMRTEKRLMRIPVLMITSDRDLKFTAASFAAGATLFLLKPFTPAQFQTTFKILVNDRSVAA